MEWNELEVLMVIGIVGFIFALGKIDRLAKEVTLLKSNVDNLNIQVPKWEPGDDGRLFQRIESLEYQVFGASGNKIDYGHNRLLSSRLWHLEDRVRAGAGWLKLDITNDESKTELDNVTYCIRSAAYQMTKKPE
jgi:hypothetical protein